ncbi:hypothetical protein C6W91_20690 [Phaeobacter sp. SYSU ZJ3003]
MSWRFHSRFLSIGRLRTTRGNISACIAKAHRNAQLKSYLFTWMAALIRWLAMTAEIIQGVEFRDGLRQLRAAA